MTRSRSSTLIKIATLPSLLLFLSVTIWAQGHEPVILIPGLAGSELRDKTTRERVWFTPIKARSEDLRLPVESDPTKTHDNLIATDIVRSMKIAGFPIANIYGDFLAAMTVRGGYHEEKWDSPSAQGDHDAIYIFPYDWRLDNVENARLLVRRVAELKARLGRPDLRFNIVAHSMGGLIARYAAMYGDAELPDGDQRPEPTWAGAASFDKIILLGTPNEGSPLALDVYVNGVNLNGFRLDLPFLEDTSKYAAFTIPSGYQLLPAPGTFRVLNDRLEPIEIDLYDPKTWSRFGWNLLDDKDFVTRFNASERQVAKQYFEAALSRARRFHEALEAPASSADITFYLVGAKCYETLDAIVVYQDSAEKWHTLFRPRSFVAAGGRRVSSSEVRKAIYAKGDDIVAGRSLESSSLKGSEETLVCGDHTTLAANTGVQTSIIKLLNTAKEKERVTEGK